MKIKASERLNYSLMSEDDAEILWQLDQDKEVMRYINGGVITTREHQKEVLLPRMAAYRNEQKGWGIWKVSITQTDEYIGWVLVRPMHFFTEQPEFDNLEIGWRFKRESWGKGYATEAGNSLKQAIISQGTSNKISAFAIEGNIASVGIMKKLGLLYVKTDVYKDPLIDNEVVYYELEI